MKPEIPEAQAIGIGNYKVMLNTSIDESLPPPIAEAHYRSAIALITQAEQEMKLAHYHTMRGD